MRKLKLVLATTVALGVSLAFADKLSDFKDAVSNGKSGKGCESIPYSSERSSCSSEQSNVHEWCDGKRGPVTCPGGEGETRRLKRAVEDAKKNIDNLKDKRSRLDSSKSGKSDDDKKKIDSEISQVDKDLDEAKKTLEKSEKDVEARKKLADDAIYTLDKCIAYRRAVMNSFAYAQDKVRNENETPEITALARELRDMYEASKRGHEIQITDRGNALSTCKDSRP